MFARLAIAGLLLAHAAIHVAFLAPPPAATADGPAWPFATEQSWLLTRLGIEDRTAWTLALALVALTLAAFAGAALVALGIAPTVLWVPSIVIGATASLVLLVSFFHPWLALGVVIDLVLLGATLVAGWAPGLTTAEV